MSIQGSGEALHEELFGVLASAGVNDPHTETEHILRCLPAPATREHALAMAQARANGTPLGYVVGYQRFMGVDIVVVPGVLIPRRETELLGWEAVIRLRESHGAGGHNARVIDMCCGSGNLACGIAYALPSAEIWASDLIEECAALTRENATRLGLHDRIHVRHGDLFEQIPRDGLTDYDLIVCNPPYISSRSLSGRQDLLHHEPRVAFDGGPYGLSLYCRLVHDGACFLKPGAWLLFEIGAGQERPIERLITRAHSYDKLEFIADQRGEFRVAAARRC